MGKTPGTAIHISIHALREEGDQHSQKQEAQGNHISIHALREEGDEFQRHCKEVEKYFYPRPPRGGRPAHNRAVYLVVVFLSTPSARRATNTRLNMTNEQLISIHALREEGDSAAYRCATR